MDAVAHWYARSGDNGVSDYEDFGPLPPEIAEAIEADANFDLWPDNEASFVLFTRLQTQWRTGMSGATGLDYHGVGAAVRMMGKPMTPELFSDVQLMERAALIAMQKKK